MNDSFLKIYTDGGARGNPGPSACAFVVIDKGKIIFRQSKFLGKRTNNQAEYSGVILALEWLNQRNILERNVIFFLDSELVVEQLSGRYKIKSKSLTQLAKTAKALEKNLAKKIFYKYIRRESNHLADALVNQEIDENL